MTEYLNDYNKILIDFENLDVEILNEDKIMLLLKSLPDTYDRLISTLLHGNMRLSLMISLMI